MNPEDFTSLIDGLEESMNEMSDDELDNIMDEIEHDIDDMTPDERQLAGMLCHRIVTQGDSDSDWDSDSESDVESTPTTKEDMIVAIESMIQRGTPCLAPKVDKNSTYEEVFCLYKTMRTYEIELREQEAERKLRESMAILQEHMSTHDQGSGLMYLFGQMLMAQANSLVNHKNQS